MSVRPGRLVLLGHPVHHSLSPVFQNAALRSAGVPLTYEALDVTPGELASTLRELAAQQAAGNVTVPHKGAVYDACARRTPLAERTRAVNTFWIEDGALVGDNTDVAGFGALLARHVSPARLHDPVAVVGAGGAAAAVLVTLADAGAAEVRVWNRNPERARALVGRGGSGARAVHSLAEAMRDAQLVVNATTLGLRDDVFPVSLSLIPRGAVVLDLVYRREETPWVRAARAAGHEAADGLEMLIAQGAAAFERWFGIVPDVAAMRAALRS